MNGCKFCKMTAVDGNTDLFGMLDIRFCPKCGRDLTMKEA